MRYIKADQMLHMVVLDEEHDEYVDVTKTAEEWLLPADEKLEIVELPAEIVSCKDCRDYDGTYCFKFFHLATEDGFCKWGKSRVTNETKNGVPVCNHCQHRHFDCLNFKDNGKEFSCIGRKFSCIHPDLIEGRFIGSSDGYRGMDVDIQTCPKWCPRRKKNVNQRRMGSTAE